MTGRDHERAMLVYARLAAEAHARQQSIGRDRFLLLTSLAAVQAGWPGIAERCREIVLRSQPAHLVAHHATMVDSIRCPENAAYFQRLERFCVFEKAEHLLREMGADSAATVSSGTTAEDIVSGWLSRMQQA